MKKFLLLCTAACASLFSQAQNCSDIFISEYLEGTHNNKAIELYNPTANAILLDGQYSMGRDRDGAGNPMLMPITGLIQPYSTRVFVLDKRDPNGTGNETPIFADLQAKADTFVNPVYVQNNSPMYFNGDDAFALVKNGNTLLDVVGKIGEDPGEGWFVPGDPFTRWWTVDNTLIRKSTVQHGVMTNPNVFDPSLEWDSLPVNTFDSLGFHRCICAPTMVSVNELELPSVFSVYPNPLTAGNLMIKSEKELSGFTVINGNGQIIKRESIFERQRYYNLNLPEVAPGVYIIEVEFMDGTKSYQKLLSK